VIRRLLADRLTAASLSVVVLLLAIGLFMPFDSHINPLLQDLDQRLAGPTAGHLLGTDPLGRDLVARMVYGARISEEAVAIALLTALLVGLVPGLLAGYLGGWIDVVISRCTDGLVSFPPLVLAIAIVGSFGAGLRNAMIAVGIVLAPLLIRVVRASVLVVRDEAFVEAARVTGATNARILVRHIFPNVVSNVIVQLTNMAAFALLAEAGLSFLGLGVQAPDASWGSLLREAARYSSVAPALFIPPGVVITLAVLSLNLFGDGLRQAIGAPLRIEHDL
jgi:peptide/nickel transport system permease protein